MRAFLLHVLASVYRCRLQHGWQARGVVFKESLHAVWCAVVPPSVPAGSRVRACEPVSVMQSNASSGWTGSAGDSQSLPLIKEQQETSPFTQAATEAPPQVCGPALCIPCSPPAVSRFIIIYVHGWWTLRQHRTQGRW